MSRLLCCLRARRSDMGAALSHPQEGDACDGGLPASPPTMADVIRERKKKAGGAALGTLRRRLAAAARRPRDSRPDRGCEHARFIRSVVSSWRLAEVFLLCEELEAGAALRDLATQAELAREPAPALHADLAALYRDRWWCDVEVAGGGWALPAHRVILAARCTYFRDLLQRYPNCVRVPLEGAGGSLSRAEADAVLLTLYAGSAAPRLATCDSCAGWDRGMNTEADLDIISVENSTMRRCSCGAGSRVDGARLRRLADALGFCADALHRDLRYLLDSGELCDARLSWAEGATVSSYGFRSALELPCHRLLLAARSRFFRSVMSRRGGAGGAGGAVFVDEKVLPRRFARALLHAAYTDQVDLSLISRSSSSPSSSTSAGSTGTLRGSVSRGSPAAMLDDAFQLYEIAREMAVCAQVPRDADSGAGLRGRGGARAVGRHAAARAALGLRAARQRLAAQASDAVPARRVPRHHELGRRRAPAPRAPRRRARLALPAGQRGAGAARRAALGRARRAAAARRGAERGVAHDAVGATSGARARASGAGGRGAARDGGGAGAAAAAGAPAARLRRAAAGHPTGHHHGAAPPGAGLLGGRVARPGRLSLPALLPALPRRDQGAAGGAGGAGGGAGARASPAVRAPHPRHAVHGGRRQVRARRAQRRRRRGGEHGGRARVRVGARAGGAARARGRAACFPARRARAAAARRRPAHRAPTDRPARGARALAARRVRRAAARRARHARRQGGRGVGAAGGRAQRRAQRPRRRLLQVRLGLPALRVRQCLHASLHGERARGGRPAAAAATAGRAAPRQLRSRRAAVGGGARRGHGAQRQHAPADRARLPAAARAAPAPARAGAAPARAHTPPPARCVPSPCVCVVTQLGAVLQLDLGDGATHTPRPGSRALRAHGGRQREAAAGMSCVRRADDDELRAAIELSVIRAYSSLQVARRGAAHVADLLPPPDFAVHRSRATPSPSAPAAAAPARRRERPHLSTAGGAERRACAAPGSSGSGAPGGSVGPVASMGPVGPLGALSAGPAGAGGARGSASRSPSPRRSPYPLYTLYAHRDYRSGSEPRSRAHSPAYA
ncbi:spidroin-1 isoform X2 [Bicyclus anynana]|uniref:Spidroin-1 isoform X2 n=1 Tax=Bicyclus anynana TaxID=110368 RepID=A0ABM3M3M7_BICAN|nr:spidroin-1 isoform X2 [Bicyclus anynana]